MFDKITSNTDKAESEPFITRIILENTSKYFFRAFVYTYLFILLETKKEVSTRLLIGNS